MCSVSPGSLTFSPSNSSQEIFVATSDNMVDEGTNAVAYKCEISHSIRSTDPQFSTSSSRVRTVEVVNDDEADIKLRMVSPNSMEYTFDVHFIPFVLTEGGSTFYGVRLSTIPRETVKIRPEVSIIDGDSIFGPRPQLSWSPPTLEFDRSTWNATQRLDVTYLQDNFDHKVETFQIIHNVISKDAVLLEKTKTRELMVAIDAFDDDVAGINLEENGNVVLREGGEAKVIRIVSFNSEPAADVAVRVRVHPHEASGKINIQPSADFAVSRADWKNILQSVSIRALKGISVDSLSVRVFASSDDPNYNGSKVAVDVPCFVQLLGKLPSTEIKTAVPKVIAKQHVPIEFTSPSPDVDRFEWRLNENAYTSISCPNRTCTVHLSFLEYRRHRFEVRAISKNGAKDETPAYTEWKVDNCNDGNAFPSQYAKISSNGALECIDCPEPIGSNCNAQFVEWDGVYANPGWWTSGSRRDTYFMCQLQGACIGGQTTVSGNTSVTEKSRCKDGHKGVLCAICEKEFYMIDNTCTRCLPSGEAEALVGCLFGALSCLFVLALLHHMRVHDHSWYWKRIRSGIAHKKTGASRSSSLRRKDKLTKEMKIFLGFIQITSVSESAFKIPWPNDFVVFLRFLGPFNFDFLALSGFGCLVEYNFFHTFATMVVLPLVVAGFVFLTYCIGLLRHKHHFGKRFTHAMRVSYTNHVLQFTMWLILLIYPPLSRRVIEFFNCSESIDGKHYLTHDFRVECFTAEWNAILPIAVASVALYPLGIPLYFAVKLVQRRKNLDKDVVLARYGFLYGAYRRDSYLWDVWEMVRKLFLTGVIVVMWPGKPFQVIVVVLCNICFLTFLTIQKPHLPGPGRWLAFMASFAITMTMLLGLVLKTTPAAAEYSALFSVLLVGMNTAVSAFALYLFVSDTCGGNGRKASERTKTVPTSERTEGRVERMVKAFFAANDLKLFTEAQLCRFMEMPEEDRQTYSSLGDLQRRNAECLASLEKQVLLSNTDREEKQKERTVLQALAGSGKAEDRGTIMPGFVETLKGVRKKYGAQSSEYKTTSGLLNKVRGARTETREEAINEYQAYVKTIGL
jgi:hypothetical protein